MSGHMCWQAPTMHLQDFRLHAVMIYADWAFSFFSGSLEPLCAAMHLQGFTMSSTTLEGSHGAAFAAAIRSSALPASARSARVPRIALPGYDSSREATTL